MTTIAQKMKFSIKYFFSKCEQIHRKLRIWSNFTEEILNGKLQFLCSTSNPILSLFWDTFALSPLNIDPICFKNSRNPSCMDLLLTNFKPSFMNTNVFETGISDHHKMISTIMKLHFTRESPKAKYYRTTVNLVSIALVLNSLSSIRFRLLFYQRECRPWRVKWFQSNS